MERGNPLEEEPEDGAEDRPFVAVSCTSPDRTVFAEEGNTEAWIATDLTVETTR